MAKKQNKVTYQNIIVFIFLYPIVLKYVVICEKVPANVITLSLTNYLYPIINEYFCTFLFFEDFFDVDHLKILH